ncbi:MAG: MCE family protein [Mycobacteriales bacterium]|nr:MCE family protein [Mycobacteriales bacterium]
MISLRRPPRSAIGMALFLAMTLGTTGVLFSTIAGRSVGDVSTYTAVFSDATRLLPGDDVRIAGVRVGRVREVELARDHTARVTFAVRRSVALPASTRAVIRYRDLVGARYLGLGSSASVQEPGVLRPGATIPLSRTTPALDLTVLLDGFQPLFSALEPAQVNALAGNLVRTLQGEGGTLASLLATTASLTTTLADRDLVIGRVVDNLGAVLATVDDRDAQLRELVDQLARLAAGLAGDRQAIGDALEGITALSTSTAGLLEQARPPLTRDIASLRIAAEEFEKSQGDLQNLMDTLPVKLNAFTRAGSYGAYLNFFVCDLDITLTLPGLPPVTAPGLNNNEELCQD